MKINKKPKEKSSKVKQVFIGLFLFLIIGFAVASTIISDTGITTPEVNSVLYVEAGNGADIQVKIDSCPSTGCKVIIPSGTYIITTNIDLKTNLTLIGAGVDNTIIKTNINLGEALILSDNKDNLNLRDFTLIGSPSSPYSNLKFVSSSQVIIENIKTSFGDFGISITGDSSEILVNNILSNSNRDKGITITGSKRISVTNSILYNNTNTGGNGAFNSKYLTYENIISYNNGDGLGLGDCEHCKIISSTIYNNTDTGISIFNNTGNTTNFIFSGNIIYNNFNDGIKIKNRFKYGLISDNIIYNNAQSGSSRHGIKVEPATDNDWTDVHLLIQGNKVYDNQDTKTQRFGFHVSNNPSNMTIVSNDFRNNLDGELFYGSGQDNFISNYKDGEFLFDGSNVTINELAGTGNDFACLDSTGKLFRSNTSCA